MRQEAPKTTQERTKNTKKRQQKSPRTHQKQRQQTLFVTMQAIMNYQKEYFITGDEKNIKPMILKDIANEIEMDISTISRVANSKYVDTPYGTKLLKEFFSESMKTVSGEEISTIEIKKILEKIGEKLSVKWKIMKIRKEWISLNGNPVW